jgi:uncharacterized protein (UPF0276 family)
MMTFTSRQISARAGIGLRAEHYQEILNTIPPVPWLEVHSENYFGDGGKPIYFLEKIREHYPVSFHGVGLSLGSTDPLNSDHLQKLKKIIERFSPALVSEHLSWSSVNEQYLNDLLPLPYTEESLALVIERVMKVQNYLQRQILIENPSTYLEYRISTIPEYEFITQVAAQTGCGILLDVNNVYVSAMNHQWDAKQYIQAIPKKYVQEIHLAGFTQKENEYGKILIDTHNQLVHVKVWDLYRFAISHLGAVPTLIEWDTDLPELNVLLQEAEKTENILGSMNEVSTNARVVRRSDQGARSAMDPTFFD